MEKTYIAIDLKSFYASAECVELGKDTLDAFLVVADPSRTEKTICLAVSPALKSFGIPGRARVFEVIAKVKEVNEQRRNALKGKAFSGKTTSLNEFLSDETLMLDFIIAKPKMSRYMSISTQIYEIYKRFVSSDDIVVYSVDEVFIDATYYIGLYKTTAEKLVSKMIKTVLAETGITATAGIGTNLYLCKIALDIEAKKAKADENGVRIAFLDEKTYREKMWSHRPITDFWRVGKGYAKKLAANGMFTMGDIALKSTYAEDRLYKLFGVNAELLIDHAWGYEPTEIKDIRAYKPENNSISNGQVLQRPYKNKEAELVVKEMSELLSNDLVQKGFVASQAVLTIVYDVENIKDGYKGEVVTDSYGRVMPKPAHGSHNLPFPSSSSTLLSSAFTEIFSRITDKTLTVRKIYVCAEKVLEEKSLKKPSTECEQLDMFTDYEKKEKENEELTVKLEKEKKRQQTVVEIQKKYGKNAVLKGINLEKGATAKERNGQIGGHKA